MIDKLPDDTQLQVILMDELRPGDVVIVNLNKPVSDVEWEMTMITARKLFPLQEVLVNNASFSINVVRPGQERRKDAQQSDVC